VVGFEEEGAQFNLCATEPILRPIGCTAAEARAGFLDRPTTVVLIVSTSLTIALFAAIYIGFFAR
jgi:hypothetical protein